MINQILPNPKMEKKVQSTLFDEFVTLGSLLLNLTNLIKQDSSLSPNEKEIMIELINGIQVKLSVLWSQNELNKLN